jgi:hypothetical protein
VRNTVDGTWTSCGKLVLKWTLASGVAKEGEIPGSSIVHGHDAGSRTNELYRGDKFTRG